MTTVEFYQLDSTASESLVGTVTWDGQRLDTDSPVLEQVIQRPILVMTEDCPVMIKPDDGERFIAGLASQYRSPYFYATEPRDDSPVNGKGDTEQRMEQNQARQKSLFTEE